MNSRDIPNNIMCIHVMENKKLTYEYRRENTEENEIFPVGCLFKSFISVLVGIAIFEGMLHSVEDYVCDYFNEDLVADEEWHKLKIKHVLSKTTGLLWPGPNEKMPETMKDVFLLKFTNNIGTKFEYKPDIQIIIYLLEKVYGMTINKIFENKLLCHFKDKRYSWKRGSDMLYVPIQTIDELGVIMINKGCINEKRLFTEEYYEESISPNSSGGFPEMCSYGLGWWINKYNNIFYFYGAGFGGQILAVIPLKKMIVTVLSDMDRPHPENHKIFESFL